MDELIAQVESEQEETAESDGDEVQLFREFQRSGDPRLRDALVLKYQGLAQKVARRYGSSGEPIEDLIQEGYVGLIKAVDRFNPEQGVKFITYATHTISGEIRHYLRDLGKLIQEPGWHAQLRYRILKSSDQLFQKLGRTPEPSEIARALDMKEETVRAVLQSGQVFQLESLDAPEDDSGEDSDTRVDRIESPQSFRDGAIEERLVLRQAIGKLKKLERAVVFGFFYQEYSKTEIARKLGISVNYTSYLVKRALGKLKEILSRAEEKEAMLRLERMERKLASVESRIRQMEADEFETGLSTRAQFMKRVREEISRAKRYKLEFAVLVLHVIWAKNLETEEDRAAPIETMSGIMQDCCRKADVLSQVDDDTFAALLPHTGTKGHLVGERILKVASESDDLAECTIRYRIAIFPKDMTTAESLLNWMRTG